MKKLAVKIKNVFKFKHHPSLKEKIETLIILISLVITLIVYKLTKNIIFALIPTMLSTLGSIIFNILSKDKNKKVYSITRTYQTFYKKFFAKLDISRSVQESLIEASKYLKGTELASKMEKYFEEFETNKNILPPLEYYHSLVELDFIRYIHKGLVKTKINSTYITKLNELYEIVYIIKKEKINFELLCLFLLIICILITLL